MTGLARSTVAQRVDALLARDLLVSRGDSQSTGGRPATMLAFNHRAGVVLSGDLGATHSRVAVTDLGGAVLAQTRHEIAIAEGPEVVLAWLEAAFDALLDEIGRGPDAVRGVGVGLPGPVEFATGRPVNPPIMPGWDRYPVGERLAARYGVPALVDNDVNIMAVGEHWSTWRDEAFLLFVKMGTGIGSGIVAGGHVHRGADGAAATSATSTCPTTTTSCAGAATGAASRRSPAAAPWPPGCERPGSTPTPASTWSTASGPVIRSPPSSSARPGAPWVACSRRA